MSSPLDTAARAIDPLAWAAPTLDARFRRVRSREQAASVLRALEEPTAYMLSEARRYLLPGNSDTNIEMAWKAMLEAARAPDMPQERSKPA